MHRRAAVREAVRVLLATIPGVTLTVGRVDPDEAAALPSIALATGVEEMLDEDEQIVGTTPNPWPQLRALAIEITVTAGGPTDAASAAGGIEDAVDALALSVEQALNADSTLGGACSWFEYRGLLESEQSGEIEQQVAVRVMAYRAEYRVDARDPQALI